MRNIYSEKQFMNKKLMNYLFYGALSLRNRLERNVTVFTKKLNTKLYYTIIKQYVAAILIVSLIGYAYNKDIVEPVCAFDTGMEIKGYCVEYEQYPNSVMFNGTNYYVDTTKKWNYGGRNLYFFVIDSCHIFYTDALNRKMANSNKLTITINNESTTNLERKNR